MTNKFVKQIYTEIFKKNHKLFFFILQEMFHVYRNLGKRQEHFDIFKPSTFWDRIISNKTFATVSIESLLMCPNHVYYIFESVLMISVLHWLVRIEILPHLYHEQSQCQVDLALDISFVRMDNMILLIALLTSSSMAIYDIIFPAQKSGITLFMILKRSKHHFDSITVCQN